MAESIEQIIVRVLEEHPVSALDDFCSCEGPGSLDYERHVAAELVAALADRGPTFLYHFRLVPTQVNGSARVERRQDAVHAAVHATSEAEATRLAIASLNPPPANYSWTARLDSVVGVRS